MTEETRKEELRQKEALIKQLQDAEQKLGVLRHKEKQQKPQREAAASELRQLARKVGELQSDLSLAYKNLERKSADLLILKKAFVLITQDQKSEQEVAEVMAR